MNIVLQAAPQAGGGNFTFLIIMVVIMCVFMIFPSMRRQRQEKKFYGALKKGDKVIMKSGLHGRIIELTDTTVVVETLCCIYGLLPPSTTRTIGSESQFAQ